MARIFEMCDFCKLDKTCDYKCVVKKHSDFMTNLYICPKFIYDNGQPIAEDEMKKDIPYPVKRVEDYYEYSRHSWWAGYCPRCNQLIRYNFEDENRNNREQYCWKCGQLCDFKDV